MASGFYSHKRRSAHWVLLGVLGGLALHGVAGWWSVTGLAQGTNTSFTTSTTTSAGFESPPACSVVGSSRMVDTVTTQHVIGPACIGVGNRDISNPSPACAGLTPAAAPSDPSHGTVFLVAAGTDNFNINTLTTTIQCVAAVPALPWPALACLVTLLCGIGAWGVTRRRRIAQ